jgi:quercetin dioxygenase-like cupin family protein
VVREGRIAYQLEGEAVQHLGPGDAFYEPAGARVARFDNEGGGRAVFTAFYLLERDERELIRMLDR